MSSSPTPSPSSETPPSASPWQRLRGYWVEAPNPNPLVDQSLARAYIVDTRDTPLSAAVTAAVFWVLFLVLTGDRGTLVWAVLVHAMQWNMHRHLHRVDPDAIDAASAARTRRQLELRMLFPGLVWALAPWLFFPHGDLAYILLMYFFVSGTTGVIIAALAQWWLAAVCFGVPVFLSLALRLVLEPGSVPVIMGCLAVSQLLASLHYARKQNRLIVRSIENGFENARLADALSRQLDHVARMAAQRARIFAAANHDLRQPMHALAIFVDALDTRSAPSADNLRFMRDSVDALRGSIDALLDIAQLDGGAAPVRLEPLRLDALFRSLDGRFAALAEAKGLALRIRPTEAVVRADARMLARVLGNLVDNAIKYTPVGTVFVLARRMQRPANGMPAWRIEVRDSGVGIEAQHREQVFEEFFQVDNPGRDRSRGLGLGLSLVAGMAQVMGSRIEVRSAPGRGSTFSLVLEEAAAPPAVPEAEALAEPAAGRTTAAIRILVLDDEQPVREAMRSLLGGWGHEVALAANPREALQHGGVFDLMLSDLRLGSGLSGLAAAQALQAVGKARNVVILTGETAHANRVEVERAGYALIYKPADARALQDAIAASRPG
ncbi:signal transduction histidine kinase/CheY-like chemotaxis protein [Variovorax boronicumulans]|uniref:ATP-binding response regulator n=1 Tax=Variovorax boronicumulans TaxID=436515 RepID=UPI00277F8EB3|nr:ATP-binding protein [Variovorax boronicumulans]MDP9993620.1 signal transduction histidine kinase/CheY-like chemotaxis protein [Variovorax boronicumulans]MDQ0004921.1 signal transduction histidine kinase/CheY-like chemotaxis protein [Variovorax boronicumulans]